MSTNIGFTWMQEKSLVSNYFVLQSGDIAFLNCRSNWPCIVTHCTVLCCNIITHLDCVLDTDDCELLLSCDSSMMSQDMSVLFWLLVTWLLGLLSSFDCWLLLVLRVADGLGMAISWTLPLFDGFFKGFRDLRPWFFFRASLLTFSFCVEHTKKKKNLQKVVTNLIIFVQGNL